MNLLEAIQKGTEFLQKKEVENPRLNCEWILAHLLQLPRLRLYLNFERNLSNPQIAQLRELLVARGKRVPLQHLLGTAQFHGLDFKVNSHVLIPRPETETLAERALQWANSQNDTPLRLLDWGTGSGCLAITLALKLPQSEVWAIDLSPEALAVARQNATDLQAIQRIHLIHSDGFTQLPDDLRFHLIVSNPPYIPTPEIATLQPEVRDHDPHMALDGGEDGLQFYRLLAQQAPKHLCPNGVLFTEFGDDQGPALQSLFSPPPWSDPQLLPDDSKRLRFLKVQISQRGEDHP